MTQTDVFLHYTSTLGSHHYTSLTFPCSPNAKIDTVLIDITRAYQHCIVTLAPKSHTTDVPFEALHYTISSIASQHYISFHFSCFPDDMIDTVIIDRPGQQCITTLAPGSHQLTAPPVISFDLYHKTRTTKSSSGPRHGLHHRLFPHAGSTAPKPPLPPHAFKLPPL